MFNTNKKLESYYLLSGIRMKYLKYAEPFNILSTDIKLTYNDIKLKYLTDKKYFIIIDKSSFNKKYDNKNKNHDNKKYDNKKYDNKKYDNKNNYSKPTSIKFTPEETASYI